jgi:hypothetical protein
VPIDANDRGRAEDAALREPALQSQEILAPLFSPFAVKPAKAIPFAWLADAAERIVEGMISRTR